MGPSEHSNLFLKFFELLEEYNFTFVTQNFRILSDEGKAIIAFAKVKNCPHFFCYRHLIEKVGSSTIIGQKTRRLLFQTKVDYYKFALKQALSDVNYMIDIKIINEKQLNKFVKIFDLKVLNDGHVFSNENINYQHALWNREEFGISTCSNHIERLHRSLNEKVEPKHSISSWLLTVMYHITSLQQSFSSNSRKQAKSLISEMKHYAQNHGQCNEICPHACNWNIIYFHGFNINGFPCKHTVLTSSINFVDIQIPEDNSEIYQKTIVEKQIPNWDFSEENRNDTNVIINELKNTSLNIYHEESIRV